MAVSLNYARTNGGSWLQCFALGAVFGLSAIAFIWTSQTVMAQKPMGEGIKAARRDEPNQTKPRGDATTSIPECFEKLNLSSEQQEQLKSIVHDYDKTISVLWSQFSGRYMQAIKVESTLLAAIEDNLAEWQRKQVRDERRKMARHEKSIEGSETRANQAPIAEDETAKPANAGVETIAALGVRLSDEQEADANKVQGVYRSQLRSLTRDIQGMHTRIVSLEADKLLAMELVLTKDQLVQLRADRKNPPAMTQGVESQGDSK